MSGLGDILYSLNRVTDAHQKALANHALNESNAMNKSHHNLKTVYTTETTNGEVTGVSSKTVRQADEHLQNSLLGSNGTQGRAEKLAELHQNLQRSFGAFGDKKTSANKMATLMTRINTLASSPTSPDIPRQMLEAAKDFAKEVNTITNDIQNFRAQCDQQIEEQVASVKNYLSELGRLNGEILFTYGKGGDTNGLQNQRYEILENLSKIIPISCQEDEESHSGYIQTVGGMPLVDGAFFASIDFKKSTQMSPNLSYENGDLSGVIDLKQPDPLLKDITRRLKGGSLEALFTIRDADFPAIQAEFDEWADAITREFNAITSEGTAFSSPSTLNSTREFAGDADALNATGTLRVALSDKSTQVISAFVDIDLSTLGTVGGLRGAIEAIGGGVTVTYSNGADGFLSLNSNDPTLGISLVSLTPTKETTSGLALPHYLGFNTLFHNSTTTKVGCANTLAINGDWLQSPTLVPKGKLTTDAIVTGTSKTLYAGDASIISALDVLRDKKIFFAEAGNLTDTSATLTSYASFILSDAAYHASAAKESVNAAKSIQKSAFDSYDILKGTKLEQELLGASQVVASLNVNSAMSSLIRQAQRAFLDSIR